MENKVINTKNRELFITRVLNAPVDLVWEAWTSPEHIANWWGPDGFNNTIYTMDVRPGGLWHFMMHGPDGTDYENKSIFKEIVKFERIVYEHISYPKQLVTISFEARGEQTLLTWHMLFESAEVFELIVKTHGAAEGLKQNVAKLEVYVKGMTERS